MHTSVPAQYEKCRNIGVWRCDGDAHLLVHAQSEKLECTNQLERWGQCSLRYPPTAKLKLKPWHHVQGGVVESKQRFGEHGPWRELNSTSTAHSQVSYQEKIDLSIASVLRVHCQ